MGRSSLSGQVALVTGASQGIGAHLAAGLSRRGMLVAGLARTRGRLEATLAEIAEETGVATFAVHADVTDRAALDAAVTEVRTRFGAVDLLVNCAGLVDETEAALWQADPDSWWEVVASHVRGAQLAAGAVVPAMVDRGSGRVVNLASGMGTRAVPEYSAYSVGKAAQIRLTECLAEALEGTGVLAFNIAPGLVRTPMTESMPKWEGNTQWTPPGRIVDLVCAVAEGELDHWAGRFLRGGVDLPDTVREMRPSGADRQLRLRPYGPDDPLG